ncbi:MAG: hypothetical protein HN712_06065 [Gemmatimonadetes bacterium]|jgi:hypothetical protein|nr:hypothetical protein [Gemmatimonadota bacterium]MBT7859857.1 hypothetical protein [Gemmatimonadota bacterium]
MHPSPAHPEDVQRHLEHLYADAARGDACRATSGEEFSRWQEVARPQLERLLGFEQISSSAVGHQMRVTEASDCDDMGSYTRRQICLETEPNVVLKVWELCPKSGGPFPTIITPHGHEPGESYVGLSRSDEEARRIVDDQRDVAVQAVERGFLALAPATRGLGSGYKIADIGQRHDGRHCVCHNWQVALTGRTLMGERVWDMQRLIDWALERGDVDGRLVMLGNSGGGMTTLHSAACDQRIQIAVPSCAYNNYISPHGTLRHCPCNAIPGILQLGEFWDVAALVAPRPMLTINGRLNPLHPVEEVDTAVERLSELYAVAGVPDRYEHRYGEAGHRFYADLMWPWIESRMASL